MECIILLSSLQKHTCAFWLHKIINQFFKSSDYLEIQWNWERLNGKIWYPFFVFSYLNRENKALRNTASPKTRN